MEKRNKKTLWKENRLNKIISVAKGEKKFWIKQPIFQFYIIDVEDKKKNKKMVKKKINKIKPGKS